MQKELCHAHCGFPKPGKFPSSTNVCWVSDTFYQEYVILKSTLGNSHSKNWWLWLKFFFSYGIFPHRCCKHFSIHQRQKLSIISCQQLTVHSWSAAAVPPLSGEQISNRYSSWQQTGESLITKVKHRHSKTRNPRNWMLPYGHLKK